MSDYDLFGDYEPEQPATLEEDRPEPEPVPKTPKRPQRKRSGGRGGGVYNFISFLFLIATVGIIVLTVLLIQNPILPFNPFPPPPPQPTPTLFLLGAGSSGGSLVRPTQTLVATSTRVPTTLPRVTQPQITATAAPDLTVSPGGSTALPAVTNTLSFEPFTLQNEAVTYTQHPKGCDGLWIVGQIFDIEQKPLKGLAVIARWEGNSALGWSGYANQWGVSGYEIYLNSKPVELEIEVQLLAGTGQPLSEPVVVRTLATCDRNVAIANFIQNHPFSP